jgi:hypothetical protein
VKLRKGTRLTNLLAENIPAEVEYNTEVPSTEEEIKKPLQFRTTSEP